MEIIDTVTKLEYLINKNKMVLIYFGGKACGVCTTMKPKVEEILLRYPEVKAIEIDIENALEIAANYSIFTIPGILVFVEGKESIREARYISMKDIEMKISRYYNLVFT